ncbi:MAG: proline--tRNA ligase [Candidatus Aenigmatarchaeota archaeon]
MENEKEKKSEENEKNINSEKIKKYKKNEDFSKWYNFIVQAAKLADYSPIKGFMFILPYGYEIWENIKNVLDKKLKETGHRNAYAPALIPEHLLEKEKEHVKGFSPECFWVTLSGSNKLAEKLALRPTSETIIYYSYAKFIRSWRDLPLLLNFWNSVFRAEIKMTKLFIRTCEFLWQEGHTVHATEKEAEEEIKKIISIYRELIEEYLAIPTLYGKKSESEKFPGAKETYTLEGLMPDGKALQLGTVHNLGQNFARVFGIKFLDKDEKKKFAWQTCWGVSTRLIGAMLMVHGDDKGAIIPPKVAPIQIVIIPIIYKGKEEAVIEKCKEIEKMLEDEFRVYLDDRKEYTPGWKFNEWELRGVPLRIEIGPKDIEESKVTIVRRDNSERITIDEIEIKNSIREVLADIQSNLYKRAEKFLKDSIFVASDYNNFKKFIKKGFVKACICSSQTCEEKIKEETGATIRLIPLDKEEIFSNCIYCNKKAEIVAYFARGY